MWVPQTAVELSGVLTYWRLQSCYWKWTLCICLVSISLSWPLIERNLMEWGLGQYKLTCGPPDGVRGDGRRRQEEAEQVWAAASLCSQLCCLLLRAHPTAFRHYEPLDNCAVLWPIAGGIIKNHHHHSVGPTDSLIKTSSVSGNDRHEMYLTHITQIKIYRGDCCEMFCAHLGHALGIQIVISLNKNLKMWRADGCEVFQGCSSSRWEKQNPLAPPPDFHHHG